MNQRLLDVAMARGGVLSARHATACGVARRQLTRLVGSGALVRLRTDAYVVGDVWRAASRDDQAVLRIKAVLLSLGGWYAAASVSSLALHGLPVWGTDATMVHAVGPVLRGRTRTGLRMEPLIKGTTQSVQGWICVRPATALVDAACSLGLIPAVVSADAALHRGLVTRASLEEAVDARAARPEQEPQDGPRVPGAVRPHRHEGRVASFLKAVDPQAESVGESRLRLLMADLGFRPRSQVEIRDADGGFVARVDFLLGERVVVEFDGLVKYEGADGRAALAREKAREDALRALDYVVIRFVWSDLDHPDRVLLALARGLARAKAA